MTRACAWLLLSASLVITGCDRRVDIDDVDDTGGEGGGGTTAAPDPIGLQVDSGMLWLRDAATFTYLLQVSVDNQSPEAISIDLPHFRVETQGGDVVQGWPEWSMLEGHCDQAPHLAAGSQRTCVLGFAIPDDARVARLAYESKTGLSARADIPEKTTVCLPYCDRVAEVLQTVECPQSKQGNHGFCMNLCESRYDHNPNCIPEIEADRVCKTAAPDDEWKCDKNGLSHTSQQCSDEAWNLLQCTL